MAPSTKVSKNLSEKSILVTREFRVSLPNAWRAYTESTLLDQWWGPSPWKAQTKSMNFSVGGFWLYAMVGPENQKHWGRMNFLEIHPLNAFKIEDVFCDENGTVNHLLPTAQGEFVFSSTPDGTRVEFKTVYATDMDLKKVVEMGFEQGIAQCFEQLDTILKLNNPF